MSSGKILIPVARVGRLYTLLDSFLWTVILITCVSTALIALVYSLESARGTVAWLVGRGASEEFLGLWALVSSIATLFVPVIIKKTLFPGIVLYAATSLPALVYIISVTVRILSGDVVGSSISLIIYFEAYILLLVVIGFTARLIHWLDDNKEHFS